MPPVKMELVYYPDPRLHEASKPVRDIAALKDLLPEMFELMYRHRGIGLAGVQAGVMQRVIVANITGDPQQKAEERVFINPEVVGKSGEVREPEGCLSLPGIEAILLRSETLTVQVTNLDGKRQEFRASGLFAKLFQHEIDHLDGILIWDKMSAAEKKQWGPIVRELEHDFKRAKKSRKDSA
jgi:peptide deformylase